MNKCSSIHAIIIIVLCMSFLQIVICDNFSSLFKLNDENMIHVLDSIHTSKSYISFILDKNKNVFLVKQSRFSSRINQFKVIRECLSAFLAQMPSIESHKVKIMPVNFYIPGKFYYKRPGTVHSVVPGYPVSKILNWPIKALQQSCKDNQSYETQGLQYSTIKQMALHPDLPSIVAFDTFIGNVDRSTSNIFYDDKTDHFFLIDMEKTFKKNLCKIACFTIKNLLNDKKFKLKVNEVQALIIYSSTLKELVNMYNPKIIIELLEKFVIESNLEQYSKKIEEHLREHMNVFRKNIYESYESVLELIPLIEKLISKNVVKYGKKLLINRVDSIYKSNCIDLNDVSQDYKKLSLLEGAVIKNKNNVLERLRAYKYAFPSV